MPGGALASAFSIQLSHMQTRYLILASLITALVILVAGAWWFYARSV